MRIQTLNDIKEAIKDIPDKVLDRYGVGYNEESDMLVTLLCWGEADEVAAINQYSEDIKKYPSINLINKWVEKIAEMGVKQDSQKTPDEPQEEAMYVEEVK